MKQPVTDLRKGKAIAVAVLGLLLFSVSMSFMFDFQSAEIGKADPSDFIKVKDGTFSFLDSRGYNLEFNIEINQILLFEIEKVIGEKKIYIISENGFGRTVLTFDLLPDNNVKFTVDHKGNIDRDYWFRIGLLGNDFQQVSGKSVFQWDSGYFDYSDMIDLPSFWIDSNSEFTWLSARFLDTDDFFIDPLLSPSVFVGEVDVSAYDLINVNDTTFYDDAVAAYEFDEYEDFVWDNLTSQVAYWKFNEGSGNITIDEMNVHNGTINTTATLPEYSSSYNSVYNYSLDFNDTDQVKIPDHDELSFTDGNDQDQPFSFEAMVRPTVDQDQFVLWKGTTLFNREYWFKIKSGGGWEFTIQDANQASYRGRSSTNNLFPINNWRHVIGTYSGSETYTGLKLYINGAYNTPTDYISSVSYYGMENTSAPLYIGASYPGLHFDGKIDNVRIWNEELSATTIAEIFARKPNSWFSSPDYVSDSSLNSHTGSHDLTYQSDTYNSTRSSYSVNGSWNTDYVSIPASDDFYFGNETVGATTNQPFSIGVWTRWNETSVYGNGTIVTKYSGDWSAYDNAYEWHFAFNQSRPELFIGNGSAGGSYIFRTGKASGSYSADTWIYFVFTYDGSLDYSGIKVYVNGSLKTSDIGGGNSGVLKPFDDMSTGATIGSTDAGTDALSDFTHLDDLTIWNRELNGTEINYLFNMRRSYLLIDSQNNVTGENYAYFVNGSSQVFYEVNYTTVGSLELSDISVGGITHFHQFIIPYNYSFVNTTFGDGTFKTVEDGFEIVSYNSTHDLVNFTAGVDYNGLFNWYFLTPNSIVYLDIDPHYSDGLQTNITSISYNIQVANESIGLINYPVMIAIKFSDDSVFINETKTTGVGGWLNSSITVGSIPMLSDKKFYVCITGMNDTFMGYMVKYFLSYQDFTAPVINQINYNETIEEMYSFFLDVEIIDDFTGVGDLTVYMNYGYVSSGSLSKYAVLNYVSGLYVLQLTGHVADTTIWFEVVVEDNLSNSYTSPVFSSNWIEIADDGSPSGGTDDGAAPSGGTIAGADDSFVILMFVAGAGMVLILGYAIFRRTKVRTRTVKTKEVTTSLGGFGSTKETIEEKG